ncbi:unnamed protein product [Camellia sinensis]
MDYSRMIFAVIGFSASFFLCLPNLKKWQHRQMVREKMKMISTALKHAEERAIRYEERHDRILKQICSYYLLNQELLEALSAAKTAMDGALQFATDLRDLQINLISSYPFETL